MSLSKLNIPLLRNTQRLILLKPEDFCAAGNSDEGPAIEKFVVLAAGIDPCKVDDVYTTAKKLLGINEAQAASLFVGYQWPLKFCRQYRVAPSSMDQRKKNARLAVSLIDHFIERGA